MEPKKRVNFKTHQDLNGWVGGERLGEPLRFFTMKRDHPRKKSIKVILRNRVIWMLKCEIKHEA